MELRKTFNEDEVNYDLYRPGYADALYQDIFRCAALPEKGAVLEIGIGTGQATLPFLQKNCEVTGAELGDRLSAFVRDKYSAYPNFRCVTGDFMELPFPEQSFDLIFSATAFHWLPFEAALQKVRSLLKPAGTVALFWNHPFPNRPEDPTNAASKRVYDALRPSSKEQAEFSEAQLSVWKERLQQAGFSDVQTFLYRRVRTLRTEQYLGLINTYSDHRALAPDPKAAFESEMRKAIDAEGGFIRIYDTMDLYLGRM